MKINVESIKEFGVTFKDSGVEWAKWGGHQVTSKWTDTIIPIIKAICAEVLRHARTYRGAALVLSIFCFATWSVSRSDSLKGEEQQGARTGLKIVFGLTAVGAAVLFFVGGSENWR